MSSTAASLSSASKLPQLQLLVVAGWLLHCLLRMAVNVCCCPVPDWQLMSIVEVNGTSVLQYILLENCGLRNLPSVQDSCT